MEQIRKERRKTLRDHWEDDLSQDDRFVNRKAQRTTDRHFLIDNLVSSGPGLVGAHRIRANRTVLLRALRADARPSHIVFSSGQTGMIPDRQDCTEQLGHANVNPLTDVSVVW